MTTIWPQKLRAALGMIMLLAFAGGCDDAGPARHYGGPIGYFLLAAAAVALLRYRETLD